MFAEMEAVTKKPGDDPAFAFAVSRLFKRTP
jgi:hypothetical protein